MSNHLQTVQKCLKYFSTVPNVSENGLYNPQGRLEGNLQDTEARNRIRQTKVNNLKIGSKVLSQQNENRRPLSDGKLEALPDTLLFCQQGRGSGHTVRSDCRDLICVTRHICIFSFLLWPDYL